MAGTYTVSRSHLIYGLCLPLALLLGYLLAEPLESSSLGVVVLVLSVLMVPLLMKWYHPALIFTWNSAFYFSFLPGSPAAWVGLAFLGAIFMVLNRCVDPQRRLMAGGEVAWALIGLMAVVIITAFATGGVGLKVLGSATFGGRKYIYVAAAVLAYFVLTSQRIPKSKAELYASLFFLSGVTTIIADVANMAGGKFHLIYLLISPETVTSENLVQELSNPDFVRITGWVNVSSSICLFFLARYGLKGILNFARPWRLLLVFFFLFVGLYGGFRSFIGFLILVFGIVFFMEGLHRTRYLGMAILIGATCAVGLVGFAKKMPLSVQRSLSFLPIEVDPIAALSAKGSLDWRFDMWKEVKTEVPRYLLKGKGYVIDPGALFFSWENAYRGYGVQAEWAIVAGDYHNGPLSVLIPFGIWGALAFGWFLFVATRLLYRYCRYGDPTLRTINQALFACFLARMVFFFFLVGGLTSDLPYFVGLIGLAVCLNGKPPESVPSGSEKTETD